MYRYCCCASAENAADETEPTQLPGPVLVTYLPALWSNSCVAGASFSRNTSFTNVPSLRKTWNRLCPRSQTYTNPSRLIRTQCVGLNCGGGGPFGSKLLINFWRGPSSGGLPYAPQCRLYSPVVASKTMMRR